jgi:predicted ATPase
LDGVASLIDKSLLQQTEQEGEEARLVMLETIREYGLEVLAASGEMEASLQALAHYYLALAEEAEPQLSGTEQARWVAQLEREQENIRAALSFLLERARTQARRRARWRLSWLCACVSPCPGSGTTGAMGEKGCAS